MQPFTTFLVSVGWNDALAITALVVAIMALPTVFQMFWGSPKLVINFERYREAGTQGIICQIINPPIKNRVLKALGVRRATAEDVVATFQIQEKHTNKVKFRASPEINKYTGERSQRVTLPASKVPNTFGIAIVVDGQVKPGFDPNRPEVLQTGLYKVSISIEAGEKTYGATHEFVVQDEGPFVYWNEK